MFVEVDWPDDFQDGQNGLGPIDGRLELDQSAQPGLTFQKTASELPYHSLYVVGVPNPKPGLYKPFGASTANDILKIFT